MRASIAVFALLTTAMVFGQGTDRQEWFKERSKRAEAQGLAEPYRGIRIAGEITQGSSRYGRHKRNPGGSFA